jgi:F5/8 type C domain
MTRIVQQKSAKAKKSVETVMTTTIVRTRQTTSALSVLAWSAVLMSVLSIAFSVAAAPMHVLVKSHENGQGLLLRRSDTCYLLTANHVVAHTDGATVIGGTGARRFGEAKLVVRFEAQDLALLRVTGALTQECGDELGEYRGDLGRALSARATGSVPFVLDSDVGGPEGGVGRAPILLTDLGPDILRIVVVRSGDNIMQGSSGSGVIVADRVAGVLVEVNSSGEGKVVRIDRAVALIERFFANPAAVASTAPKPASASAISSPAVGKVTPTVREPPGNLLSVSAGATVVKWNSPPSSPAFSPSNLIDASRPNSWNAQTKSLPVEVDFRFAHGQAQTIGRLEFVLAEDQDAARAAREVEILTSMDGATWRPIHLGTLFNNETVKAVAMAPLRAAYLRLRIYKNWGDPAWVSLRQLRAFKE